MKRSKASAARREFRRLRRQGVELILARPLAQIPWLVHGFTTRAGPDGAFNLGFGARFLAEEVRANRARLLAALEVRHGGRLVALRQIHSALIYTLDEPPTRPLTGDALMTAQPGLLLAVQTADCLPILLVDLRRRAVAAIHAGWRGTLQRIVEKTVGRMRAEFATRPSDILVAMGPGIHVCCYEVGEEVTAQYESQFAYCQHLLRPAHQHLTRAALWAPPLDPLARKLPPPPGRAVPPAPKAYLDLVEATRRQLVEAGVSPRRIFVHPDCTACHPDRYFSYRREGPTGRMMGVVGIRES